MNPVAGTPVAERGEALLARARDVLRRVYGYADFRGEQAGAIAAVLGGATRSY